MHILQRLQEALQEARMMHALVASAAAARLLADALPARRLHPMFFVSGVLRGD